MAGREAHAMKLVTQRDYRGHTLLLFEERVHDPPASHWLVIAADGITIVGPPQPTEADARAAVDAMIGKPPAEESRA